MTNQICTSQRMKENQRKRERRLCVGTQEMHECVCEKENVTKKQAQTTRALGSSSRVAPVSCRCESGPFHSIPHRSDPTLPCSVSSYNALPVFGSFVLLFTRTPAHSLAHSPCGGPRRRPTAPTSSWERRPCPRDQSSGASRLCPSGTQNRPGGKRPWSSRRGPPGPCPTTRPWSRWWTRRQSLLRPPRAPRARRPCRRWRGSWCERPDRRRRRLAAAPRSGPASRAGRPPGRPGAVAGTGFLLPRECRWARCAFRGARLRRRRRRRCRCSACHRPSLSRKRFRERSPARRGGRSCRRWDGSCGSALSSRRWGIP
mmetsp:Transcript_29327/g.60993  ORF Transcript_29327/g.60993 Transcript_29327/m.60993 type:complete len:315 (-) Transcript_29327:797-1741(-)